MGESTLARANEPGGRPQGEHHAARHPARDGVNDTPAIGAM